MLAKLLFDRFEKNAVAPVTFDRARCLRSRLNSNSCDRCLALCKQGAISKNGRAIEFSEKKCTGCLVCVAECPNEAFSCGFDPAALIPAVSRLKVEMPVTLGCSKTANTETRIPCLGILSEPILAIINSVAMQDVFLDVRFCADCENGAVLNHLTERIQGITRRSGSSAHLKTSYKYNNDFEDMSAGQQRRSFLKSFKKNIVEIGIDAVAMEGVLAPGTAPPLNHKAKEASKIGFLLSEALDIVPKGAFEKRKLLCSYFYSITCSDACTLCPSCTGMCPTGALKRKKDPEEKQLCFTSNKCNGCGLCVEFCKKKALTLLSGITDAHDIETVLATL